MCVRFGSIAPIIRGNCAHVNNLLEQLSKALQLPLLFIRQLLGWAYKSASEGDVA